jgi:hypothetical protein
VRDDTRRYLRESDVVEGGHEDRFAFWDEQADALAWAPGAMGSDERSIALGYGQLHWSFSYYEPNAVDRDTRVNVEKISPALLAT